jgi:inorganic pyrophosphatase
VLAVSDYLVLGIAGLVDQGEIDYKLLAIEAHEAQERSIKTLDDFKRV